MHKILNKNFNLGYIKGSGLQIFYSEVFQIIRMLIFTDDFATTHLIFKYNILST